MRRYSALVMTMIFIFSISCSRETPVSQEKATPITNKLTEEEKAGGVMTPEIMWKFGRLGSFTLSPDGSAVLYTVTNIDLASEARQTNIFSIPSQGGEPVQLTAGEGHSPRWFSNGSKIAFVSGSDLFTMNADGSDMQKVKDMADFESFSISPAGNRILFTRRVKLEQTASEKHNLPKAKVRIIDDLMYRHWNAWSDYSYSHIFVASFDGKSVSGEKDIMEGQKFESPLAPFFDEGEISWSPDGKYIAYTTKRLTGKEYARSTNSDIFLYELSSGKETNISAGNMGFDRYPVFSPDGSKIAHQSMARDGYESDLDRLFVYDISTGNRTWITREWDYNVENICWADNQNIFFTSPFLGTTQVFSVNTSERKVMKLTEGVFDLSPINISGGVLISGLVSMSMAPELARVDIASGKVDQITFINSEIYESIKMGRVEERYIRTRDNHSLQMWIIYPPDFDPAKKYPALLYCKGGPQGPLGQSWSYRWNYQMMAAKGYIVIAPNRRGNSGFGTEWREQISGDYGGANMRDYLDATDAMVREPFVDAERLGAVGASYGGFSVFYLAGIHGGRFKAFISHCGMFNFTSWYGSTEELWFPDKDIEGPYWNLPKSYNFSPHLMVNNWDTPILIITGANDFRIPYTQSLEAFQAAQLHQIPSRLLFFEDETHFVTKPHNAIIWQREFFDWLETYLR